jgi:two-component system, cell cycle sensor histidine kinase and response regulator CckA
MKRKSVSELESLLDQSIKEADYYRKVSEACGNRRLRETEALSRLIMDLKKAEKAVEARNADLVEANRALSREIAERKRAQAQLLEAQKMEAIANLAGGIAHDFNNALVVITAYLELLGRDVPDQKTLERYCGAMMESARRMTSLTNQLLAYARGGKYQPQIVSMRDFIKDTIPIVQPMIRSDIRLELDLPDDLPNIEADLTQMQMAVSAVMTNASEAMGNDGSIRISAKNESISKRNGGNSGNQGHGWYLSLTIEDNGKGMDEETRQRIFEPFFSTKFKGRGLGMAAVYGIIKNHGGSISVDSEPEKGTAVRIHLPAIKMEGKEAEATPAGLVKGTGTILLIEDESVVRDTCRRILEKLGYTVIEAKTGVEAIGFAENRDCHIDLSILDIGLPDMKGEHVFKHLMKARTGMKVIVCSGYSVDGPVREILDSGAFCFIQKPFNISTFSSTIKAAMQSRRST